MVWAEGIFRGRSCGVGIFLLSLLFFIAIRKIIIDVSLERMRKQTKPSTQTTIALKRRNLITMPIILWTKAPQLEHIDLSQNFLQNVNQLSDCEFSQLKTFYLNNNMITDISGLARCNFPTLQKLSLFGNEIADVGPLCLLHAPKLVQLKLGFKNNGNKINDQAITQLMAQANFPNLQEFTCDYNEITGILFLDYCRFQKLTLLYLSGNSISSIDATYINALPNLRQLSLKNNTLCCTKFLSRLTLPQLEYLNLSNNFIPELQSLQHAHIAQLTRLCAYGNGINDISVCVKCWWPEASEIQVTNVGAIWQRRVRERMTDKFLAYQQ